MIKNIKLLVTFRRESFVSISYHIFETDKMKMFIDLLSESSKEGGGGGGGGGGISLLGNEYEPIFRGYVLPDQPEFWIIFLITSYFS